MRDDNLNPDGLTRGTLIKGAPGVGKTVWTAMQIFDYARQHPDRAIFSMDMSGSFTDEFLKMVKQLPTNERRKIERRIVYDRLGNVDYVIPFPFFSADYGLYYEDQVQRVTTNFKKLAESLVQKAPVLGGLALSETAPELYRLLCAIQNEQGENWQITEAKKLLLNLGQLRLACKQYGHKVPEAKSYFEHQFLSNDVSNHERELRTYSLRSLLGMIEPRPVRARVGYAKPAWTPKEAIEKGLIVLISGEDLINQEQTQAILFTDIFTQILACINKRSPHDPVDKPVLMIIDEVATLLKIPGMAEDIGMIAPLYRSRKVQLIIIIQADWQLADNLKEQIWSMGNVVCFKIDGFDDAYRTAQQLFQYNPGSVKHPPSRPAQHPILESDRGQYLTAANWLQHLNHRECILKLYRTEGEEEPFVRHIEQTTEKLSIPIDEPLSQYKDRLFRTRAIPLKDALRIINQRKLTNQSRERPTL